MWSANKDKTLADNLRCIPFFGFTMCTIGPGKSERKEKLESYIIFVFLFVNQKKLWQTQIVLK